MNFPILRGRAMARRRLAAGRAAGPAPGAALLVGAAAVAGLALANHLRAQAAERAHPPAGGFVTVDGARLHFLERGRGRPVVLLHGNGTMAEDWALSGVLDLAAAEYRALAFDRPGFGYSDRPRDRRWTPEAQAQALRRAWQALGVERPIVVGHSWGSLVAQALALDHADAVSGIVLVAGYYFPSARSDVLLLSPPAIPVLGDVMRYTVSPLLGRLMLPRLTRKAFAPAPVPERFAHFPFDLALRPAQIRANAEDTALMVPAAARLARRHGELRLPVVLVAGRGDRIVDFEGQPRRFHRDVPHSHLIEAEGWGHMVHYLAPDRVVQAIDIVAAAGELRRAV